jgi:CPA1 family monovalent cation:H+ antiporter
MAVLINKAVRAEVRAIAPSTLLVLDERKFRLFLDRSPKLQFAVKASAVQRGIDPELLFARS